MWIPLQNRNFRKFFAGQLVSQIGNWTQLIAATLLVLERTDSGTLIALVALAQFAPMMVLGPWAGLSADRFDRHRLLLVVNGVGAIIAAGFALSVVSGRDPLWSIFAFSLAQGVVVAMENPARRAFVSDIVNDDHLPVAVSLNTMVMTAAKLLTPVLAGLFTTVGGLGLCFVFNVATFVPQLVLFAIMDRSSLRQGPPVPKGKGQLRAGWTYTINTPALRRPLLLLLLLGLFSINTHPLLLPLLAQRDFEGDSATYTVLFGSMAAGSLLGAWQCARRPPMRETLLAQLSVAFGVANLGLAAAPTVALAAVVLVPVGFVVMMIVTAVSAQVQLATAADMRGRVMALLSMVFLCAGPVGNVAIGSVTDLAGVRPVLAVSSVLALALGVAAMISRRRSAISV